jgi:glycine cleavage system H protein
VTKWKTVRVKQDLLTAVERTIDSGRYSSLSEFVSEALRLRLDELRGSQGADAADEHVEYPVVRDRLLCSSEHMWAMVTPDGNIRVGLSDYAQRHLRSITALDVGPVGRSVEKDERFGFVETWMFRFDLHAPVSGKIVRVNGTLQEKPSSINEDPYETGWVAEIKPGNTVTLEDELRELMGSKEYRVYAVKQRCRMHER